MPPRKKSHSSDPHKVKALCLRLHPLLRQQLEALADRNVSSVTTEITRLIREGLELAGMWPPPRPPVK
ncbi:MAG: hypothetical protein ACKOJF_21340 [Planctomycetaceae bacterium]